MSDPTPTREQTVEANIQTAVNTYGEGAWRQIVLQILKDIDISLAELVDAGSNS